VPGATDRIAALTAGHDSDCVALGADGEVWSCNRGVGPSVIMTDVKSVATTSSGTYYWASKNDGSLWAWDYRGGAPTQAAGIANVRSVFDGNYFDVVLALKTDGTLSFISGFGSSAAETPIAGIANVRNVAISSYPVNAIVAVLEDGTVWMGWWMGWLQQPSYRFVQVNGISDPTSLGIIGSGYGYGYATLADGSLWYWYFDYDTTPAPEAVPLASISEVASISASATNIPDNSMYNLYENRVLVVKTDGTVWGLLDDNVTGQVSGLTGIVKAVVNDWCLGLTQDGQVVRWPLYSDPATQQLTTTTIPERVRIPG